MSTPVQLNMNLAVEDETPGPRAELLDPAGTVAFMLAGNAHVTFQSKRTNARFTYRVVLAEPRPLIVPTGATGMTRGGSVPTGATGVVGYTGGHARAPVLTGAQFARPHFVSVLTAPDHYEYLGTIFDRSRYVYGVKSRISPNAPSAAAFYWVWQHLTAGRMPKTLAVYHEGRCGKCGRRLTTPESISTGLGPICAGRS